MPFNEGNISTYLVIFCLQRRPFSLVTKYYLHIPRECTFETNISELCGILLCYYIDHISFVFNTFLLIYSKGSETICGNLLVHLLIYNNMSCKF